MVSVKVDVGLAVAKQAKSAPPEEGQSSSTPDNKSDISDGDELSPSVPQSEPPASPSASTGQASTAASPELQIDASTSSSSLSIDSSLWQPRRTHRSFFSRLWTALLKAALLMFYMLTSMMLAMGSAMMAVGLTTLVDERRGFLSGLSQCCDSLPPLSSILPLLRALALLMVLVGGIIVLLGLLGCGGLVMKNRVMVGSFGLLMLLIMLGQLNFGAMAFFHRDTLRCRLRESLLIVIHENYEGTPNTTNPFSQAIDVAQMTLGCCGVDGSWDFYDTPWFRYRRHENQTVPWTCCQVHPFAAMVCPTENSSLLVRQECPFLPPGPATPYTTRPCLQLVEVQIREHFLMLLGLLVSLTLLELTAMASAFLTVSTVDESATNRRTPRALEH